MRRARRQLGIIMLLTLLSVALVLSGCADPNGEHKPVEARSAGGKVDANAISGVGFADVKVIFAKQCAACHPARSGPDWLDLNQAKRYAANGVLFRRVVSERSMPPAGSSQAVSITNEERDLIGRWAQAGGPENAIAASPRTDGAAGASPGSQLADPMAGVEPAAQQCLQCHGLNGPQSDSQLKIPRLAGQNADYLYVQLQKFKWRERLDPSGTMNDIAGEPGLNDATMRRIAEYFASRPSYTGPASTEPAVDRAMFERGRRLASENCVQCHMNLGYVNGTSSPLVPALAGQSEQYLRGQLLYFRQNERASALMYEYTRMLKNADIEALAFYFASLSPNPK